jgi:hypothetical protein
VSGTGTIAHPYRTVSRAASASRPGDTIYVRAGTYGAVTIRRSGTPSRPITYRPYPRERAVVDGTTATRSTTRSAIAIYGSHVRLIGFHIRNPSGRGISALNVTGVVIARNHVRETWANPVIATGRHLTIEGNQISDGALGNAEGQAIGHWPGAISTWSRSSDRPSSKVVIRANHIHRVWGEGILPAHSRDVVIADNVVHDTWSANLYLTEVRGALVERNYLYSSTPRFNRNGRPADGIVIANEGARTGGSPGAPSTRGLLIRNNIISGTGYGIWFWYDASRPTNNAYSRVRILHNLVKDPARASVLFMKIPPSQAQPAGNVLKDNVLWDRATLEDGGGWVSASNWHADADGDPGLVAPRSGGPVSGFRPRAGSPLIGAGTYAAEAPRDLSGARRRTSPTIGPFERPP